MSLERLGSIQTPDISHPKNPETPDIHNINGKEISSSEKNVRIGEMPKLEHIDNRLPNSDGGKPPFYSIDHKCLQMCEDGINAEGFPLRETAEAKLPNLSNVDSPVYPIDAKELQTFEDGKNVDGLPLREQGEYNISRIEDNTIVNVFNIRTEMYSDTLIKNKLDGLEREKQVEEELREKYPEEEGYTILAEVYLRDKDGKIVKDPETGEARRIDFVVVKDGKVVDSVEVTSKSADKTEQTAKENRIRESGGSYIKDENGNLIKIPDDVKTRIERRD